ncbi:MAG: DegT/DnrJ/EryC1/StrS family aminotransferase [Limisphaerales bacterium]
MDIPLLDLKAENLALEKEFKESFDRVLKSGWYCLGEEVTRFEQKSADLLGVSHAMGVSSGTDALVLALMALGIGEGDEVLCPAFTFFASAGSIARVGATPVFVDVDAETFNINVADAGQKVTESTRAIMPVHLYGQVADMAAVMELAEEHDLAVLEDAAQCFGARGEGHAAGAIGEFGAFSFYPTKNLGALGDAGLLIANEDGLADLARKLRVHGGHQRYYHDFVGGNFRMDAIQAAMLSHKLDRLGDYTAGRRENARRYDERLVNVAAEHPQLVLPGFEAGDSHVWNQYTLRMRGGRRDALKQHLAEQGIASEIYYPVPLHRQKCFAELKQGPLPVSERLAEEVLSLPNFPGMTDAQIERVSDAIAAFLND